MIKEIELQENKALENKKVVIMGQRNLPISKYVLSEIPLIVSGGLRLKGKYHIEIALYSMSEKKTYTEFFPINNEIILQQETQVSVPSCIGVIEE
jgi:hypothetical protein